MGEPSTGRGTTGERVEVVGVVAGMLLHRDPGGGLISKTNLRARFEAFNRGEWLQLLRASGQCDEKAAVGRRRRRRRRSVDSVEQRETRAETLIQLGELSSAREALVFLMV